MFGVAISLPKLPISVHPMSSTMTRRMFGRRSFAASAVSDRCAPPSAQDCIETMPNARIEMRNGLRYRIDSPFVRLGNAENMPAERV